MTETVKNEMFDNIVTHKLLSARENRFDYIRKAQESDYQNHIYYDLQALGTMLKTFRIECNAYVCEYIDYHGLDEYDHDDAYHDLLLRLEQFICDGPSEIDVIEKSIHNIIWVHSKEFLGTNVYFEEVNCIEQNLKQLENDFGKIKERRDVKIAA